MARICEYFSIIYLQETFLAVSVPWLEASTTVHIDEYKNRKDGALFYWWAKDVFASCLNIPAKCKGKVVSDSWLSWCKWLVSRFQIPKMHALKQRLKGHFFEKGDAENEDDELWIRSEAMEASFSTFGFLMVLLWSKQAWKKIAEAPMRISSFLSAVVGRTVGTGESELAIFLNEQVTGINAARLGCEFGGAVPEVFKFKFRTPSCDINVSKFNDMAIYRLCPSIGEGLQNLAELHSDLTWVPIMDFLLSCVRAGRGADWIVVQVVSALAELIDNDLHVGTSSSTSHWVKSDTRSKYQRHEHQEKSFVLQENRKVERSYVSQSAASPAKWSSRFALKYFLKARTRMDGGIVVHMSTDAARGAKKNLLWSLILDAAEPSRKNAAWAPRQVLVY